MSPRPVPQPDDAEALDLLKRFPDLQTAPWEVVRRLASKIRWDGLHPAGHEIEDDGLSLLLVDRGELMVTRYQVWGASARVVRRGQGSIFGEAHLEPLLVRLGLVEPRCSDEVSTDEVERWLGLGRVPGARQLAGATTIVATVETRVGRLPISALETLIDAGVGDDDLPSFLHRIYELDRRAADILTALKAVEGLDALSETQRVRLLEGAGYEVLQPGDHHTLRVEELVLLLDGDVVVRSSADPHGRVLRSGRARFLPRGDRLEAQARSSLVIVPRARFHRLLRRDQAFRRRVLHGSTGQGWLRGSAVSHDARATEVVSLRCAPDTRAPLPVEALTGLVAQALVRQFDDRVVVVRVEKGPAQCREEDRFGIRWRIVTAETEEAAAKRVRSRPDHERAWDYLFLDLSGWPGAAPALERKVQRWVCLATHAFARPDVALKAEVSVLPVVCLDQAGGAPKGRPGVLNMPLRNARLALDRHETARGRQQREIDLDELPASRASLERLARAVSGRLVGLALGGGGALGLGHVALLEELAEAGIPVDVVSGTSFGSVVGAFYSAWGDPVRPQVGGALEHVGLEKLKALIPDMMGIVASTKDVRLQKVVDEQLNTMQLESTPIPFFPVATNARTMGPALPIGRTVGYGVQASSALPFVFRSPDDEETGVRFLDGAFVANVPGDLLVGCDTSLIIACNPVSPPLWWAEHRDTLEVIDEARKALPRELSRVVQRAASYGQILEWGRLVPASRPLRGKSGIPGRPLIRLGRFALAGLARLLSRHPTGLDALRGLQSLLSSLGDQSASSADVLIKPEMTITTAARFWRGEDIIEVVRAQLRQNGDIARVQAEWNRLKRSSVERTTPPAAGGSA